MTPVEAARAAHAASLNAALAARARRVHRARADLGAFTELSVRDDHGHLLRLAPLHRQWHAHVDYCWSRQLKALILAPWGHGKSSTLAVPLIAHRLGMNPGLRVKVVTNDDDSATNRVRAVKTIMEGAAFSEVFPEVRRGVKWTEHSLYLQRYGDAIDPSLHARGILAKGVGGRADLMVFDDIVDQLNAMDDGQRKKVVNVAEQTWLSRLEPDALTLGIGTAWHIADAWHTFMQQSGWCTLIQRVAEDCSEIQQEVVGAGPDYPGLA